MGIRQSFARLTTDQYVRLQNQPSDEFAIQILDEQRQRGEDVFSPLDNPSSFARVYHMTLEKSYWEMLDSIVTMPLTDDPMPAWPLQEDGPTVGDFWMGYSPLYILTPDDVRTFATILQAIKPEQLAHRFHIEFQEVDGLEDEEKTQFFAGLMQCFHDLVQLVQHAAAANDALVWYIS